MGCELQRLFKPPSTRILSVRSSLGLLSWARGHRMRLSAQLHQGNPDAHDRGVESAKAVAWLWPPASRNW
jgi:hypothetical protein